MAIRSPRRVFGQAAEALSRYQQGVAESIQDLNKVPFLQGQLLTLTNLTVGLHSIPHQLGRKPRGWIDLFTQKDADETSSDAGDIYIHDGSTAQGSIGTTFTKVTGFDSNGVSSSHITPDHTTDSLTVDHSGIYLVAFHCSFTGTVSQTFTFNLFVDGTEDTSGLGSRRTTNASGDEGGVFFTGLVSLDAGAVADVRVKAGSGAANSITPSFMQLSLSFLHHLPAIHENDTLSSDNRFWNIEATADVTKKLIWLF